MDDVIREESERIILSIKTSVINKVLNITAPFLHLAFFFSISRYFTVGWMNVYIVHTIIIASFDLILIFRHKIPTWVKIHMIAILQMIVAVFAMYSFGLTGGFFYGLMAVAVIAILEGKRRAGYYAIVYIISFLIFGYGYVFGQLEPQVDLNENVHGFAIWSTVITGIVAQLCTLIWCFGRYYNELQLLIKNNILGIHELKTTKSKLEKSLKEKEMLFKELHHRIKNNLNTVSSILFLKSDMSPSQEMKVFIKETMQRINAISNLHDHLLKLKESDQVSSQEYFKKLIENIHNAYPREPPISLKVKIEDHKLGTDLMLNIGYLLNEILTNAFKYAYEVHKTGEVHVAFSRETNYYLLVIQDFGKGFEPSANSKSLGLMIISSLVSERKGKMEIESKNGTKFTIQIPVG